MKSKSSQQVSSRKRQNFRDRWQDNSWDVTSRPQKAGDSRLTAFKTILCYPIGTTAYTGNVITPQFGSDSIQLSALYGYANYTAVFDSYRIDKVEFKWTLRNASAAQQFPTIVIYPDWDDTTAPTTMGQVASHPRAKSYTLTSTKPCATLTIVPKVAIATYNGVFTGYGQNSQPMWIDCGSPGVAHYGAKWGIWNFGDTSQSIDFSVKAWVSFREPV
jgi:hypothetical protein